MAELLIIDDDHLGANMLAKLLNVEGHHAHCAVNAGQALRALRHEPPDLVLLDWEMPHFTGLDVLNALRTEPALAHIPVAVYTGHDAADCRATALKLGACDYILKGQGWEETHRRIENCLNPPQQPA